MRNIVCLQVAKINLVIKNIERVFPTKQGIDFLGFVIYPDHTRVRKGTNRTLLVGFIK